jgi:integrase
MRQRYQFGSLTRRKRGRSEDVWEYRYYETQPDGSKQRRALRLGSLSQYPTRTAALGAVEALRLRLNIDQPGVQPVSLNAVIERYMSEEMPERHSTRASYRTVLLRWLKPKWGEYLLRDVKAVAVEQWLRSLSLAPKTKTHIRSLLHLLFQNARRWEFIDRNPIELVRQKGGRLNIPRVITPEEVQAILAELGEPYRTMVLVAACLGLRISEVMGLQWHDFDWENLTVLVQRSVVQGRVGETKTEYSRRPLPLDPDLAASLLQFRAGRFYVGPEDWVFAGDHGRPQWTEMILRNHVAPAAERAGVGKIGWHTFRHTYSTMLRSIGTDVKVQQELLRHADIQTTMNIYTQAVSGAKRDANSKVVRMILPADKATKRAASGGPSLNGS